ncbi:MAG: ferritin family protein [Clostridium perfringens]|nr:ferritin family protein [Clostridium perfringens]
MKQEIKEQLLKYQQAELDGVLVYQALAKLAPNEDMKSKLLGLAADEGRHAAILRKYTDEVLTASDEGAKEIAKMYKELGNKIFAMIADAEDKGEEMYRPFVEEIPEAKSIMEDEVRHGKIARSFLE